MIRKTLLALAMLAGTAAPALAASETLSLAPRPIISQRTTVAQGLSLPAQLTPADRAAYRAIFAAIRARDWTSAAAALDARPDGLLTPVARAELYLTKGSPKVATAPLLALLVKAPELPQAQQIARLMAARGVTALPALPVQRDLVRLAGAPKRRSARSVRSDAAAAALAAQVQPLLKADRASEAEMQVEARAADLTPEALTEWRERVAWCYYLAGDDASARRMATMARSGAGEWIVQADWVAGLAAWRARDYAAATDHFSSVVARASDPEMTAAGLFWAARADMASGHPERVQTRLRSASRLPETFYGMLANASLGNALPAVDRTLDLAERDWATLSQRSNARVAAALVEVDEPGLADQLLRHQARIGALADHEVLLHLAARLDLPATQIWLAQHGPAGVTMTASARYPMPGWTPQGGWRVDKALLFAHALQESQFRADAVSPAGARGLMQLMPGTAQLVAKQRGESAPIGRLNDPALNFEYGQSYLQQLADFSGTGGLLPKVIAAYNAGPGSVANWNARGRNLADPLLFIESIPFVETRAYVAIVLRNYWMYQQQSGVKSDSLKAMAQGMWPRFPGLPGKTALRLDSLGRTAAAD
ncbi:lytic transglycosylase [Sphingomonas oleivorans]|uniref:Lytic transglycosylase n=1 Tax=Sphingomonas oleivorans TaxID=1735121 RepID=A0A2T5FWR4_9SPHN|nr:lytic transglycosylase domain-containing protein [Sphingomonas oleivorans]PTQ10219.1 lytic transglycosylase [Sphingomonas oleivorans]